MGGSLYGQHLHAGYATPDAMDAQEAAFHQARPLTDPVLLAGRVAELEAEIARQSGMARQAFDVGYAHQERANRLEKATRDLLSVVDDMDREIGHRSSGYYIERRRFEALSAALAGGAPDGR